VSFRLDAAHRSDRSLTVERSRWCRLPLTRRQVRGAVGALWLLDAALQAQPALFNATTWRQDIAQSAMAEPRWVSQGIFRAVAVISAHPDPWNTAFVTIQALFGLALILDRWPRTAIWLSVPYALGVWWVGEGFGGLPTGFALLAAGAPGAVLLYPLLGFLAWPTNHPTGRVLPRTYAGRSTAGPRLPSSSSPSFVSIPDLASNPSAPSNPSPSPSPSPQISFSANHCFRSHSRAQRPPAVIAARAAVGAWVLLWAGQSLLVLLWSFSPKQVLTANIEESSIGEPRWLLVIAHHAGAAVAAAPLLTTIVLVLVQIGVGLGVLFRRSRRPALVLGLLSLAVFWVVGQDLGGVLARGGSDPNAAPLLAILALGLWPAQRSEPEVPKRSQPAGERTSASVTSSSTRLAPKTSVMRRPTPDHGIAFPVASEPFPTSPRARFRTGHRTLRTSLGIVALVLVSAVGLAACSSSSSAAASAGGASTGSSSSAASDVPAASVHVIIKNFAFHPDDFTVKPGATVTVTNDDTVDHTFTARDRAFNTGDIAPGQTVHFTAPTKPGQYPYLCLIHQFMTGTLTVS